MTKENLNLRDLMDKCLVAVRRLRRYRLVLFLALIALVYGFILWRINNLSNVQPSEDAVNSQVEAARLPHIDQSVIQQLQSLQDNSVNVKSLFDQARSNPFQ